MRQNANVATVQMIEGVVRVPHFAAAVGAVRFIAASSGLSEQEVRLARQGGFGRITHDNGRVLGMATLNGAFTVSWSKVPEEELGTWFLKQDIPGPIEVQVGALVKRYGGSDVEGVVRALDAQGNAWVSWSQPLSEGPYSPHALVSA